MLQDWLVVALPLEYYTVSTVLFHKDGGANFSVTNFMSRFYMLVPTKATVKLFNINTGHAQVIGIILCCFPNCSIIYPVGQVYYFSGHPYNIISSDALKCYVVFKSLRMNLLNIVTVFYPQGRSWRSPYQTQNNIDYLQI